MIDALTPTQLGLLDPLTPENSVLLYLDLQPQYVFSVHTINAGVLINNATGLAKAAKVFGVPTIFTTITSKIARWRRDFEHGIAIEAGWKLAQQCRSSLSIYATRMRLLAMAAFVRRRTRWAQAIQPEPRNSKS